MSLIINHNISALNTHRNILGSGQSMAKSIEKLSSGYKINVGADDPSGLIISEQLRSQISGLERAVRNSSEAFNLIGIAEGALNEMNTILKKMRALAIHAANSGVTSPEQVAADQSEMDSGIETLNRIANTTRYSDQYLLNGQKQLVYDVNTSVNEPTDHSLLDTKMTRIDQVFKRDGVKMSIGFTGEKNQYQANTDTSAQRAYLEADNAFSLSEIDGDSITANQEFILTGTSGSRLFSFSAGAHLGEIVSGINNVRDSTGIGASLIFASDVRIDQTVNGTPNGSSPNYQTNTPAESVKGYDDGTYIYQNGDVQIYGAGLNNVDTAKISEFTLTPDAATSFKVGFNCDGDGKIYAKVVDKSTNSIEYYKDRNCTMLIGKGDDTFFSATNNSGIPSSPIQSLDGIYMKLNTDNAKDLDVFEIGVIGQRLDNQKDMAVNLAGWSDTDNSVMSGVNLGVNTSPEGGLFYEYVPREFEADGETVKTFEINVYMHESREPKYLVATSGIVENNMKVKGTITTVNPDGTISTRPQLAGQTVRVESVTMDNGANSGLNITINLPKKGILDNAKGLTVDELKEDPYYKQVMEDLKVVRGDYAEIADAYTSAKDARETAIKDLQEAQDLLDAAREKEARVRREIDRLDVRDIDQQVADATRDLNLATSDIYAAARDAMFDESLEDAYMNVAKTSPGAPDAISEELVNAVIAEVTTAVGAKLDPAAIDWEDEKAGIIAGVWTQPPLDTIRTGLSPDDVDAIEADVDSLLSAAYDAATTPERISALGDATTELGDLTVLETNYNNALAALDGAKAAFDTAVGTAITNTNAAYAALFVEGKADDLVNKLAGALIGHMDSVASDATLKFSSYDWQREKKDVVDAAIAAYGGFPAAALGTMTEDQARAALEDMFDVFVEEPEIADYGTAAQKLAANPNPDIGDFNDEIADQVLAAVNGVRTSTSLSIADAAKIADIETWTSGATNADWDELSEDIAKLIADTIDAATPPAHYTDADLTFVAPATTSKLAQDLVTALSGINTAAAATTYPALFQALNGSAALPAVPANAIGASTANATAALTVLVNQMVPGVTASYSAVRDFVQEKDAYVTANAAVTAAGTGAGGAIGTASIADGTLVDEISAITTKNLTEPVGTSPKGLQQAAAVGGKLSQAIADSLAKELLILAQEGFDLDNLNPTLYGALPAGEKLSTDEIARVKDLLISNIYDSIPTDIAAGIDSPAALKQFVADVYTAYVEDATLSNAAGEIDSYGTLVNTFADTEALYAGGAIKRAEDRLERYADRLEAAPAKAETSATTRKPWQRLSADYAGADAQLEELAADFGKYVRDLVESKAAAGTQDNIVWNSGDATNDVYDWLQNEMKNGATSNLWDDIQAKIATDPEAGNADLADLNKIVQKMFDSVTKPDYNEDVAAAVPSGSSTPGEFVFRSPAKKYFDQYDKVEALNAELEAKEIEKEELDEEIQELYDQVSNLDADGDGEPDGDLVLDLIDANNEFAIQSQEADPLLDEIARLELEAKNWLAQAGGGKGAMPPGNNEGDVYFTNLGMRIYAVDYGSAETIRIQNKAGNLFYQYRESDSMERLMVEPDKTVQVAGQDAQIALNGAPVFTTGLVADTTTPDFSGSLVFNAGVLGETSLAVAGYDAGQLFSKATALQGVEENEADIAELRRSFEPPAMSVPMGDKGVSPAEGLLNKTGNPVNLYMDFSQLDPSVEVKIDNFGNPCPIEATFTAPDQLTINANSLGTDPDNMMTITVKVDPQNLSDGYYVTDPALKGLFIKTDDLVDLNMSGGDYTPAVTPTTTPAAGNTMLEVTTYATNPRKNTSESMENFLGGMQFQLGNTEGDQDRTVYSIQSMAMSELGRISWNGTEYCLQNVLGGGVASLSKDPILAMRILEQAVDDVSTLRARLGAFQSNMLQSNINSLGVAIENITKTESAIRDTDMAEESTQFTRFQIMQQAGTSMLAQANQVSQNVLSLLQ